MLTDINTIFYIVNNFEQFVLFTSSKFLLGLSCKSTIKQKRKSARHKLIIRTEMYSVII